VIYISSILMAVFTNSLTKTKGTKYG